MRCAMILRICDMGTKSPGTADGDAGAWRGLEAATGALWTDARTDALGAGAAERCSTKSRTSCLVTRPPVPLPLTLARSTLCSRASLRTSGDERTSESCSSAEALAVDSDGAAGVGFCEGAGAAEGGAAALAGADAEAPLPSPITPTTVLTCTVF